MRFAKRSSEMKIKEYDKNVHTNLDLLKNGLASLSSASITDAQALSTHSCIALTSLNGVLEDFEVEPGIILLFRPVRDCLFKDAADKLIATLHFLVLPYALYSIYYVMPF